MVTQQNIIDAVKAKLLASTELVALIGDRIYELQSPQKAFFPFLTIYPITDELFDFMGDGATDFSMLVQIDITAKYKTPHGLTQARAINEIILALMKCSEITVTGSNGAQTNTNFRGIETIENQECLIQSDYRVFGTVT